MNDEERFQIGAEIRHPDHGICTITFIGEEYLGVRSENGQEGLIRKDILVSWSEEAATAPDEQKTSSADWPDNTFVQETDDQPHYLGSHWEAFYEDSDDLIDNLPEILSQTSVLDSFGSFRAAPRGVPEEWETGAHLCWPNNHCGLAITLRAEESSNHLISLYPYISFGREVTVELCQVSVWHSGVEAQIDAIWGNFHITFFDVSYLLNRCWYESGKSYQFILSGLAYRAKPCEASELTIKQNPDIIEWQRKVLERMGEEASHVRDLETVRLEGTAIFMPIQEWDRDDYWFRGVVREVKSFDNWLGQSGWQVRVMIQRFDGEEGDIDIFITQRAWSGGEPPQAGQDIEGEVWLNGQLWRPSE